MISLYFDVTLTWGTSIVVSFSPPLLPSPGGQACRSSLYHHSHWGCCMVLFSKKCHGVVLIKISYFSFLPFSIGRRVCIGESMSMVSLHLLTALLFQRYSFVPPDGVQLELKTESGLQGIIEPFKILAKPRSWRTVLPDIAWYMFICSKSDTCYAYYIFNPLVRDRCRNLLFFKIIISKTFNEQYLESFLCNYTQFNTKGWW